MLCLKRVKIEPLSIEGLEKNENNAIEFRIERLLAQWEFTPYFAGQNVRGRGVDCVHFVASIYDELTGKEYRHTKLPQDAAFHNKEEAEKNMRKFFKMYPCFPVEGGIVQPGDIIICGPSGINGGPGHGMIVGTDSLWHVNNKQVCMAGLAVMQQGAYAFKQIRRLKNRSIMLRGPNG